LDAKCDSKRNQLFRNEANILVDAGREASLHAFLHQPAKNNRAATVNRGHAARLSAA